MNVDELEANRETIAKLFDAMSYKARLDLISQAYVSEEPVKVRRRMWFASLLD